jgi:AbrB family looped-hinge helix DNA binding protein
MVNISITKMSSKGQVVIPQEMREDLSEGDKIILIRNENQIILKKMENFEKNIEEDLKFAKRTEDAWKEIESGKCTKMEFNDFLKEMKTWSK